MLKILMQLIFTIVSVAALIGIKALELPALITALLVVATVLFCLLAMADVFGKKRSV